MVPLARPRLAASHVKRVLVRSGLLSAAFALGWLACWASGPWQDRGATPALDRATAFVPPAEVYVEQSLKLIEAGRHEEAIETAERGLRYYPTHPDLRNNKGVALLSLGRVGEGERVLALTVEEAPDFNLARNNLAWARSLRADVERQLSAARERSAPGRPTAERVAQLMQSGALHTQLAEHEAALASYLEATRLDPSSAPAANNAGVALMQLGRTAEAEAMFLAAAGLEPGVALYANNASWAKRESKTVK
jgi:Flp pilus assembly protein TadD